jgi:hypothetical protein
MPFGSEAACGPITAAWTIGDEQQGLLLNAPPAESNASDLVIGIDRLFSGAARILPC